MKRPRQEVIGAFTVINNRQEVKKVVISQDMMSYYSGDVHHVKRLNLDDIHGVEVYKTRDPNIFKLPDGTILKKRNSYKI